MPILPVSFFDVMLVGVGAALVGSFNSVSGLGMNAEYEEFQEGGSDFPRFFFKGIKQRTLTLEQGVLTTFDDASVLMGMVSLGMCIPLSGTVIMRDSFGNAVRTWVISGAYLQSYEGPRLDAGQAVVAVNKIELLYNGCC